jgi:hypothetical protein
VTISTAERIGADADTSRLTTDGTVALEDTSFEVTRWQVLRKLLQPGALLTMLTGWRTSAGSSVIGAIEEQDR